MHYKLNVYTKFIERPGLDLDLNLANLQNVTSHETVHSARYAKVD